MEYQFVIKAGKAGKTYWKDIWLFRELFYILSWRDIKVRYKQTVIGIAWSIIRPLLTMLVFTVIFGKIAKLPSDSSVPYAIMVFAAMLPWTFFSTAMSEASNSLISNTNLISKVYFPRIIIPISSVITSFVDFLISLGLLIGLFFYYAYLPSWHIIFIPIFLVFAFFASIGAGLLLSSLNVKFRDFRYIIPFIVQFGLYISPVGFTSNIIPAKWRLLYNLNPLVGIIDGFRWCIIPNTRLNFISVCMSVIIIIGFMLIGIKTFRKMEKGFADYI